MYVGLKMLKDVVTVTPDTLVSDADKIMVENRLWMLLVTDGDKLVGCVYKEDVREALPSRATTLSRHELNYLLAKLTIRKILRKEVPTIYPEAEIEVAAYKMYKEDLPGLAVVDKKDKLLGYINRSAMLGVLVEEMGLEYGGSRIVFDTVDKTGVIAEVSNIIAMLGISIIATGTFFYKDRRIVVLRVQTNDPEPVKKAIAERGYIVDGPDMFAAEWSK